MPYSQFDRKELAIKPLSERINKTRIEQDYIPPERAPENSSTAFLEMVQDIAVYIRKARNKKASVMLSMGAHTIKNGMAPTLIKLIETGWLTHLATNGAGIIHDWEFAFQGESCEDVQKYVDQGQFGIWEETGRYLNLALVVGAYEGKGYGESVGAMIEEEGLYIPTESEIMEEIFTYSDLDRSAAGLDLLATIRQFSLSAGWMSIPHPFKQYSIQAAAYRMGVPLTGHPMIGHDIIYTHPVNKGSAIGRTALRDFLTFVDGVNRIEAGVYLSIGSAVMSPMIFEKALSMAQNIHIQAGKHIDHHVMLIVDLAANTWDWEQGEPPQTNPAYYLRYLKTFSRMGGQMKYLSADNRDFLLALYQTLTAY